MNQGIAQQIRILALVEFPIELIEVTIKVLRAYLTI
jgi:hypothetical protein